MKERISVLSIALMLLLMLFALGACGNQASNDSGSDGSDAAENTETVDSIKTLGDAFALNTEDNQWAVYDGKVVYAFKHGDTYYRVWASISEEEQQAYIDIDFSDADYEEQQHKILDPLEIENVENLSDQILSQDELSALAGKTGKELVDEGWTYQGSYYLDDMEVWMDYGPFEYSVKFDGSVSDPNSDSFDIEAATKDMRVKTVELSGMGDATSVE